MSTSRESLAFTTFTPNDGLGAISVSAAEFQRFELAGDQRLEQLISRWLPLAAPHQPPNTRAAAREHGSTT